MVVLFSNRDRPVYYQYWPNFKPVLVIFMFRACYIVGWLKFHQSYIIVVLIQVLKLHLMWDICLFHSSSIKFDQIKLIYIVGSNIIVCFSFGYMVVSINDSIRYYDRILWICKIKPIYETYMIFVCLIC